MYYKIGISDKAENDLKRISEYLNHYGYNGEYVIKQINTDIDRLNFMPRIHKTLISHIKMKMENIGELFQKNILSFIKYKMIRLIF